MLKAVVIAAFLIAASPAQAATLPGVSDGLDVAADKWGTPPCGTPSVESSTPQQYVTDHDGLIDLDSTPLAWADEQRCVIVLNRDVTIRTAAKRCHVIVHEWGHLAGFQDPSNVKDPDHSLNPNSVMYADDEVTEGRVRVSKKRSEWRASGAFKPCYAATDSRERITGTSRG